MNGVNDLAWHLVKKQNPHIEDADKRYIDGFEDGQIDAAYDIEAITRHAWKPVSEPPTEADGDENGLVLVRVPADEESPRAVMVWPWNDLANSGKEETEADLRGIRWARISDVILMPPEGDSE